MTEPPRRKRFQIHLSTATVMMFVAGALMWANTRGQVIGLSEDYRGGTRVYMGTRYCSYGWPRVAMTVTTGGMEIIDTTPITLRPVPLNQDATSHWYIDAVGIDGIISLEIIFCVWLLCEWLISSRAARKGDMTEPSRSKSFQFHLSTAIVMILVAGVLILANAIPSIEYINYTFRETAATQHYGWPYQLAHRGFSYTIENGRTRIFPGEINLNHENAEIDVAIALHIMIAVWFICEWLIRRRAARKGA